MSDDMKHKPSAQPPMDFGQTVPHIKPIPKQDNEDFGATVPNFAQNRQIPPPPTDFGHTFPSFPSRPNQPKSSNQEFNPPPSSDSRSAPPLYEQTQNFNFPPAQQENFGSPSVDFGATIANFQPQNAPEKGLYDATSPNFHVKQSSAETDFSRTIPYLPIPEAEIKNPPPPPETISENASDSKKGYLPLWIWVTLGSVFGVFFIGAVLLGTYFFLMPTRGYIVTVKGAQPNSTVYIDDSQRGVTQSNGSIVLQGIESGEERTIRVGKSGFEDFKAKINGTDGTNVEIIAQQNPSAAPANDCERIASGDFAASEKCANAALDALSEPFTIEQLLKALNLYRINFASGKSEIPSNQTAFLQKAAGFIKKIPTTAIEIGGHTDSIGNAASNQSLSVARAVAVKNALVSYGVNEKMLETRGYGATKPKSSNDSEDGRFQNRRIEYTAIVR